MATAVVSVPQGKLGAVLRSRGKAAPVAMKRGLRVGAERGRSLLVGKSPVYTGHFKNAWRVRIRNGTVQLENDDPIAGVIERGARPHAVSREGVEAIREWVRRKAIQFTTSAAGKVRWTGQTRGLTRAEADGEFAWLVDEITWGIVNRIRRHGQKGTFIVQQSLPQLRTFAAAEMKRAVHATYSAPYSGDSK